MTPSDKMNAPDYIASSVVIVPAYNEDKIISDVLIQLKRYFPHVICVDDGSNDGTYSRACEMGVIILKHSLNLGQGAALETGIRHGLSLNYEYFITFDGDGQHDPADVLKMLESLHRGDVDIVMGSRFLESSTHVPRLKKIILKVGIVISRVLHRIKISDVHNGLRVMNRQAAQCMKFQHNDMAHASEIYDIIRDNNLKFIEHPVTLVYTSYSRAKGQSPSNSLNILTDLLLNYIKRK